MQYRIKSYHVTVYVYVYVYAYGPKIDPAFLRLFAFGVIRGEEVGWGGGYYNVLGLRPSRPTL